MVKVVLRCVNHPMDQPVEYHTTLPNGKRFVVSFNVKNNWEVTLNKVVTYRDDFGATRVFHENYPLALLEGYGITSKHKQIEFVKEFEESEFTKDPLEKFKSEPKAGNLLPPIEEALASNAPLKEVAQAKKIGRPKKKEEKHEEVPV